MAEVDVVLLVLALLGCGYDELTYEDDLLDAYCDKYMDCMFMFETLEECREKIPQGVAGVGCEVCDFHGGAAQECLTEFEALDCEWFIRYLDHEVGTPSVCADVFTGCDVAEDCE